MNGAAEKIALADAFQLVGRGAFNDWCSAEQFWELEQAENERHRPALSFPQTRPAPFVPEGEYGRASEQYEAVARWLNDHGFGPREQEINLAELRAALTDDPLNRAK